MHRYPVDITFAPVEPSVVRDRLIADIASRPRLGDSYLANRQFAGTARVILVDRKPAGAAVIHESTVCYVALDQPFRRLARQALEALLFDTGVTAAVAASWDSHHLDLLGGFATEISSQAYQFELDDPAALIPPSPGLSLRPATLVDLPWLRAQDFLDDCDDLVDRGELRVAQLAGRPVGIGCFLPHLATPAAVDVGMYVCPDARGGGLGSSIVSLLAGEGLAAGRRVTAGCWWRNWASRPTLERAGLTCVGTIFNLVLDPAGYEHDEAGDLRVNDVG